MTTRQPERSDINAIKRILDDTDLFPSDMLDAMIEPFFADIECQDKWFVIDDAEAGVVGFSFIRPEAMTEGVWNVLAIGCLRDFQGRGVGSSLILEIESTLASERLLLVETSSESAFDATRKFYNARGFSQEAVIRDFWGEGDDKVVFWKALR